MKPRRGGVGPVAASCADATVVLASTAAKSAIIICRKVMGCPLLGLACKSCRVRDDSACVDGATSLLLHVAGQPKVASGEPARTYLGEKPPGGDSPSHLLFSRRVSKGIHGYTHRDPPSVASCRDLGLLRRDRSMARRLLKR